MNKNKPLEQTWVFTFGLGQNHDKCYTMQYGDYSTARDKMIKAYGSKWAFQYKDKKTAGVEKFGLKFITEEEE